MKNTRIPLFWGIHAQPGPLFARTLSCIPFIIAVALYGHFSAERLRVNSEDKILPSFSQMAKATYSMAFTKDRRTDDYLLRKDTVASLKRIVIGVSVAAVVGLWLGINMGVFRGMGAVFGAFFIFVSIIPPLAVLPILFMTFGVDELAKIMLIIIGGALAITRSMYLEVSKIPREQIIKVCTLGASQMAIVYRIILPQMLPRLIDTIRIVLGASWLFLIAAEAMASTEGLGYRIYLMQRHFAMDVIIPYVLWLTFLGFVFDRALRWVLETFFRWYCETK